MRNRNKAPILLSLLLAAALPAVAGATENSAWLDKDADLRFTLVVDRQPTHPEAGIVALLPNGGILPRPACKAVVYDQSGKRLRSACIWFNPLEGMGIVFEPTRKGSRVDVYLQRSNRPDAVDSDSHFRPSVLLYTRHGPSSLSAAARMSKENPPSKEGRMGLVDSIGWQENPFGLDDNYITYYTAWMKREKPGKAYFATISDEGSECRVDGKLVAKYTGGRMRRSERKGSHGQWVDLAAGWHHIEYLHFETTARQEMNLVWRAPETRKSKLPRTIPASEYVHSGKAKIVGLQSRARLPLAAIGASSPFYVWYGEKPLNIFNLKVESYAGLPPDTSYSWTLPNGGKIGQRSFLWPIVGEHPRKVRLQLQSPAGKFAYVKPVYLESLPRKKNSRDARARSMVQDAYLNLCQSMARDKRPCVDWTPTHWETLASMIDPGEARQLLAEIFTRSWQDVRRIDDDNRVYLETMFYFVFNGGESGLRKWILRFADAADTSAERMKWRFAGIEHTLYVQGDPERARRIAKELQAVAQAAGSEQAIRLKILRGDIELVSGNEDAAKELYVSAREQLARQGRLRKMRHDVGVDSRNRETGFGPVVNDWRKKTVQRASYFKTVRNLLDKGYLIRAWDELKRWELEMPMSKMDGEYPLAKAMFFARIDNWQGAEAILRTYRENVTISNYLPDAMELEIRCLRQLERKDDLRALAKQIVERFPTLPLADKARSILKRK